MTGWLNKCRLVGHQSRVSASDDCNTISGLTIDLILADVVDSWAGSGSLFVGACDIELGEPLKQLLQGC